MVRKDDGFVRPVRMRWSKRPLALPGAGVCDQYVDRVDPEVRVGHLLVSAESAFATEAASC